MRKASPIHAHAIAVSAGLHLVAAAWVSARTPPPLPGVAKPATVIELVPPTPDVAPVEVMFLDPATTAIIPAIATPAATPVQRMREAAGTEAIATGTATTIETPRATGDPTAPNRYMTMRHGGPRIELPKLEWNPDMAPEAPPPADVTSGQLRPDGGGTHRSDQGPFTAKVDRDGGVTLKDKNNFSIRIALPSPNQFGRMIADWYNDPNKPAGKLPPERIVTAPVLNAEEATKNNDSKPDHGEAMTPPILAGGFDITDAFMRGKGHDPYASKKLAFLDSTRDERVQIGRKHRSDQLARAAQIMQKNLEWLWAKVTDPGERRRNLFALWDEIEESGTEELVEAATIARKAVIGFIRARMPAGSPGAYTLEELATFNQRKQSKSTFAPYE